MKWQKWRRSQRARPALTVLQAEPLPAKLYDKSQGPGRLGSPRSVAAEVGEGTKRRGLSGGGDDLLPPSTVSL